MTPGSLGKGGGKREREKQENRGAGEDPSRGRLPRNPIPALGSERGAAASSCPRVGQQSLVLLACSGDPRRRREPGAAELQTELAAKSDGDPLRLRLPACLGRGAWAALARVLHLEGRCFGLQMGRLCPDLGANSDTAGLKGRKACTSGTPALPR